MVKGLMKNLEVLSFVFPRQELSFGVSFVRVALRKWGKTTVICKLKLWTAAILNLCKLTTFPVSKTWRLFICSSEGP